MVRWPRRQENPARIFVHNQVVISNPDQDWGSGFAINRRESSWFNATRPTPKSPFQIVRPRSTLVCQADERRLYAGASGGVPDCFVNKEEVFPKVWIAGKSNSFVEFLNGVIVEF